MHKSISILGVNSKSSTKSFSLNGTNGRKANKALDLTQLSTSAKDESKKQERLPNRATHFTQIFDKIEKLNIEDNLSNSNSSSSLSKDSYSSSDFDSSCSSSFTESPTSSHSSRFRIFNKSRCKPCVKKRFTKICQKCGSSIVINRNILSFNRYSTSDSTHES